MHFTKSLMMSAHPVLIAGRWRSAAGNVTFQANNPATTEPLPELYPVSPWADIAEAIAAAADAAVQMRADGGKRVADFLEKYAANIEARAELLVATAHEETALPVAPRLRDVELPRTTNQLRLAAAAAREGAWALPTVDAKNNIRSQLEPIGPVIVLGPNNFPFAFNSIAGGDFAAAIAAGNPVIAKGHPSHSATTRLLAEAAFEAVQAAGLPAAAVQLVYEMSRDDGLRLMSDPRIAAGAFTGSRAGGLALKAAADGAGRLFYAEMSSINPIIILPGALRERADAIATDLAQSGLMAAGQFCTSPGLILLPAGPAGESLVESLAAKYAAAPVGTLLAEGVRNGFLHAVKKLTAAGAEMIAGDQPAAGTGYCAANTVLKATAQQFLADPETFQTEAFGNGCLCVVADSTEDMLAVINSLEGNLTGTIYSDTTGSDDDAYDVLAPALRRKVGRLLNDKMPTGVAVSPAMNHGGPFPATGHPGFTAVGLPASLRRFGMLCCYDNVRPHRLPPRLRD